MKLSDLGKVVSKNDVLVLMLFPFMTSLLLSDSTKQAFGNNYELFQYLVLLLLTTLIMSWVKLCVYSEISDSFGSLMESTKEESRNLKGLEDTYWKSCREMAALSDNYNKAIESLQETSEKYNKALEELDELKRKMKAKE